MFTANHPLNRREPKLDWSLLCALLGLMVLGAAFIHSARLAIESNHVDFWSKLWCRQLAWYAAGTIGFAAIGYVDYKTLARWSYVGYWGAILLLVAVLIPHIGALKFGARRWIDFGSFQFQPSEFAKIAFIIAMANYLSRPPDELRQPKVFFGALGLMALPFVLILKEPDLGSALVLLPVGLVMLFISGAPFRYIRNLVIGVGLLVTLLLVDVLFAPAKWRIPLEDYQRRRLLVYFNRDYRDFAPPDATRAQLQRARLQQRTDSYNVEQALISVGSGGLTGTGWRQGTQNLLGYLPRGVAHNDFIFSVIAEESGFIGSIVVLSLYGVILFTGIRIAGQARDRLGKTMAVGVVTLFFSHVLINIGMNIRLMPVTGVPLPLLSYGGTSVLASLVAAGLLQNIYMHRKSY
ncbi:MAG: rod shape-determining protein RodA [Verrucomicrobia bacterium]|nr:rod shape-determining protein RodA [Verrucomicrobiota bacterium]